MAAAPSRRVSTMLVSRLALIAPETVLASNGDRCAALVEREAVDRQIDSRRIERARPHSRRPRRCAPSWDRRRRWPFSPGRCRPSSGRSAGRRRVVLQPRTSIVIRCEAPSPSSGIWRGQLDAQLVQRRLKRGQVACRPAAACVAAPLANSSTVSLVLMCPSTLMQLKLSSTAAFSAAWADVGRQRGVGRDDAEHRRHVRADHAGPFAHAGQTDRRAADLAASGWRSSCPCRSSGCRGRPRETPLHRLPSFAAAAMRPRRSCPSAGNRR